MPRTTTSCPRCRQPVVVEVEQLFDVATDPQAKQRLLSGQSNLIRCQNCGYEGMMATPIVYHDPAKELLLTYFPPELGLPVNEQERLIGPLITQTVNRLPPEKRKAYLLRPQTMLTFQQMIERVLEGEGITKAMLEEQQRKLNLLQRLLSTTSAETRAEIIRQEEALVDATLFSMFNRVIQATLAQGDQNAARQLALLQEELLTQTAYGRQLRAQASETEEAMRALQAASQQGLTREKLLELMINAASETQLSTMVGMARNGMDYEFFQLLTSQIDRTASAEEREKLTKLRETLLRMTAEIDEEMKRQMQQTRALLEEILTAPNLETAAEERLDEINELFVEMLRSDLQVAREKSDLDRLGKLQRLSTVIQKASAPPPEVALIEKLIATADESERKKLMEQNKELVNQQFLDLLTSISAQAEQQGQDPETVKQFQSVYRSAVRFSMEANLKG